MTTIIDKQGNHWSDEVDVDELHEPTVRAIIDTMKRTGAGFGAAVLEAQYRNGQVVDLEHPEATRLRELADWLEAHPEVPFTLDGRFPSVPLALWVWDMDTLVSHRRAIGGKFTKDASEHAFILDGKIGETYVRLMTGRDVACERVVVGTETKLVPDPEAPQVEKEVEVVEWRCPDALLGLTPTPAVPEVAHVPVDDDTIPF